MLSSEPRPSLAQAPKRVYLSTAEISALPDDLLDTIRHATATKLRNADLILEAHLLADLESELVARRMRGAA